MRFVYLLRCSDGTLYVGHTDDLARREQAHNEGHGSTYTESRRPVAMVYAEEHSSLQGAVARERQVKRWTGKKKEARWRWPWRWRAT
jgi:predicted GIY-YIG superfamily endonuclease